MEENEKVNEQITSGDQGQAVPAETESPKKEEKAFAELTKKLSEKENEKRALEEENLKYKKEAIEKLELEQKNKELSERYNKLLEETRANATFDELNEIHLRYNIPGEMMDDLVNSIEPTEMYSHLGNLEEFLLQKHTAKMLPYIRGTANIKEKEIQEMPRVNTSASVAQPTQSAGALAAEKFLDYTYRRK